MKLLTIVLAVTLFITGIRAAVPFQPSDAAGDEEKKLQVISISNERVEARFYTPTTGIHIVSEVQSDREVAQLSIASISTGDMVFAVDYPIDHSQGLLTINGNEFFIVNETSSNEEEKLSAYSVPETYSVHVKTEMKRHNLPKSMLEQFDHENVNATARNAIEQLLMRPEVQLIASAAFALGDTGVYGRDNPAAMVFYTTALRFATVLNQDMATITPNHAAVSGRRNRRGFSDWLFGSYCSNSDSYCINCPTGSNCLGLCGPGCNCWWIVCGDCCYNIGCYLHDQYGCPGGTDTWQCWLTAPIALVCS